MRWIVRVIGAMLILVLLSVGALFLIPAEKIAGIAVGKFNSLTGRQLVILGSVRPSIWPQLGVRTGPVTLSNAAWSDAGPMLQAEGLSISIDMAALIGGDVRITGIEAMAPQILLERSAAGEENWVFGGASGGTVTTETPGVGRLSRWTARWSVGGASPLSIMGRAARWPCRRSRRRWPFPITPGLQPLPCRG